jgi:hypothetical protein
MANIIDESGKSLGRMQPHFSKPLTQDDIYQSVIQSSNYVTSAGSANAYARWYLEAILPLPESYPAHRYAGQDNLLNPLAPLYGKVVTLHIGLCDYRHHGANDGALRRFDVANITRSIHRDQERLDFLRRKAAERGIAVAPDALFRCPYHLKAAVAISKHSPSLRPYGLSSARLVALGLRATAQYRCIGGWDKLSSIGWLLCVFLAPRPIASRLIEMRYVPSARPQWMAALLSKFRVKNNGYDGSRRRRSASSRRRLSPR